MNVNKINPPAGGRPSDFEGLSNWAVADIATTKNTSPNDRLNAEAEIARREELGTFELNAPHEKSTSEELNELGYATREGKLLYPTAALREWIKNGRKGLERPDGIIRESLDDRVEKEQRDLEANIRAFRDEQASKAVEVELGTRNYGIQEDEADSYHTIEKFSTPSRFPTDKLEREYDRKQAKKERSEAQKYDNSYMAKVLRRHPLGDEGAQSKLESANHEKSPQEIALALYNKYNSDFIKTPAKNALATKWMRAGIADYIANGNVSSIKQDPTAPASKLDENITQDILVAGFYHMENNAIDKKVMRGVVNSETVGASSSLKDDVVSDLIPGRVREVAENKDIFNVARKRAALYAINKGVTYDPRFGISKYTIDVNKGDEIRDFMKDDCKIKFDINAEPQYSEAAMQGFANIIDAVKQIPPVISFDEAGNPIGDFPLEKQPEGFKQLDWYYDNFQFRENPEKFKSTMVLYEENSEDNKFGDKLTEYYAYRAALEAKKIESSYDTDGPVEKLPEFSGKTREISNIEDITLEDLEKIAQQLFADTDEVIRGHGGGSGNGSGNGTYEKNPNNYKIPLDQARLDAFAFHTACTRSICPDIKTEAGVFISSKNRKHFYLLNQFSGNELPILVACPITKHEDNGKKYYNASYTWVGEKTDSNDKWRQFLISSDDENAPAIKRRVIENKQMRRHYHNRGNGLNSLDNMWLKLERSLRERAQLDIPKFPKNPHLEEIERIKRLTREEKRKEAAEKQNSQQTEQLG